MQRASRLAGHGRLAALLAGFCPSLQDVVAEALANVFTEQTSIVASGWLAIPLGLVASTVVERLMNRFGRAGSGNP